MRSTTRTVTAVAMRLLPLLSLIFTIHAVEPVKKEYPAGREEVSEEARNREQATAPDKRTSSLPDGHDKRARERIESARLREISEKKRLAALERTQKSDRRRHAEKPNRSDTAFNADSSSSGGIKRPQANQLTTDTSFDRPDTLLSNSTSRDSVTGADRPAKRKNEPFTLPEWAYFIIGSVVIIGFVAGIFLLLRTRMTRRKIKGVPQTKTGPSKGPAAENPTVGDSLESIALTDAALTRTSQDRLGMAKLVKGLALFFRNTATKPPITMAVTGDWGAGKSSVMRMLKDELDTAEFKSVWFNAWHHQEECHCFGALLENIRRQAIPPVWTLEGIAFRWRLAWIRFRRQFVTVLSSLLLLVSVYVITQIADRGSPLSSFFNTYMFKGSATAVILWFLFNVVRLLSDFGLGLKDSLASLFGGFRVINLESDPGLRYHLVQTLEDITKALGNDRLVIFIDDLDRCPSERIIKVLEVINFLSCAPQRSYIIIGMALERILDCVSGSFGNVVREASGLREGESSEQREERLRNERRAYARQYLNKMINIEIHVPRADAEEMVALAKAPDFTNDTGERTTLRERFAAAVNRGVPMLLFGILLSVAGLYFYRTYLTEAIRVNDARIRKTVIEEARNTIEKAKMQQERAVSDQTSFHDSGTAIPVSQNPAVSTPGDAAAYPPPIITATDTVIRNLVALLLGLSAVFAVVGYLASLIRHWFRGVYSINDTPYFVKALTAWSGVIAAHDSTPRHYIRIINQLRFLSMRARLWGIGTEQGNGSNDERERIVFFVVLRALMEISDAPEELFSLLHLMPAPEEFTRRIVDHLREHAVKKDDAIIDALAGTVAAAVKEHLTEGLPDFQTVLPADVSTFHQLMEGVTLR